MPATQQLTITLPTDAIEIIESRVSSGRYANQSEAIEAAIVESILPPHDESGLQHWIATEGVRRYDEMRADPSRRLTSDEVFEHLESHG
jgi:Arc/MetJ-type ribon-helix-helix transcriptional regulator